MRRSIQKFLMWTLILNFWAGISGCSFLFLTKAPEENLWSEVDQNCTRLPVLPIVDASIGGVSALYSYVFLLLSWEALALPFLSAAVIDGLSSYYGFTETSTCREYLEYRREIDDRPNKKKKVPKKGVENNVES